ncbi:hypothetical protein ACFQDN_21270 [Pseudomonas asuensis]
MPSEAWVGGNLKLHALQPGAAVYKGPMNSRETGPAELTLCVKGNEQSHYYIADITLTGLSAGSTPQSVSLPGPRAENNPALSGQQPIATHLATDTRVAQRPLTQVQGNAQEAYTSALAFDASINILATAPSYSDSEIVQPFSTGPIRHSSSREAVRQSPYPRSPRLAASGLRDVGAALLQGSFEPNRNGRALQRPAVAEHQLVMALLPQSLSQQERSRVNRFLCHLEQQGQTWSQLWPDRSDPRPAALESAVNEGISRHGLPSQTRAVLNRALGLVLVAESGRVILKPTLAEHSQLMASLPQSLTTYERSNINRFLCHLEQQGQTWSQLRPDPTDLRPAGLERAVNEGISQHGLHNQTRAVLNREFGLVLVGESGQMRLTPTLAEHSQLMASLPQSLTTYERSHINRFLCHLEQQGQTWSQLRPDPTDLRPAGLERAVNEGISQHGLHNQTRAVLNREFGLVLVGESGQMRLTPTLAEHSQLMALLPQSLSRQERSHINRFLCHLEQQGQTWSQLRPDPTDPRPAGLERAVNEGISRHGLQPSTRSSLNKALGLVLVAELGKVKLKPTLAEHSQLMASLPQSLTPQERSKINRFLCHLEQQGQTWSQLRPDPTDPRPAALERAVNKGVSQHGLNRGTRAALNGAFGLELK